jgi:hypothetical protein
MGLKNKVSIFDLVAGTDPVGDMDSQQGPQFQQSTNVASQVHIDSLQIVPGGTQNSPFQDLDGNPGPQFQLPTAQASQVHIDSLQVVPGGTQYSPFQDLDGVPDPDFNTINGTSHSPFKNPNPFTTTGDYMIDLLTQNIVSTNTNQTYLPSPNQSQFQDLNGEPDPAFNTFGGLTNSPFQSNTGDHHVDLLTDPAISTNTGMVYDPAPNQSQYQDLDGNLGPQFQLPTAQASQKHIDSLTQQSSYQHGNSSEDVGPSMQDMDGNLGPNFDNGVGSTLQQDSLLQQYNYSHGNPTIGAVSNEEAGPSMLDKNGNPGSPFQEPTAVASQVHIDSLLAVPQPPSNSPYQDLDGNPGPNFDNGVSSTLQQDSLINLYQYSYGNSLEETGPSTLDLNGSPGPNFDVGISSTLKQDLLANVYQSAVNPGASYGAGQPGGTWPNVSPSPLASTPFADLNGMTPTGYVNPDTGNGF